MLEEGRTGWYKIQSVFSWVRMWGGGIDLAYAAQTAVTLAVAASLAWLWRGKAAFPLKAAGLLIGTLLATPYSLDYDLMLLAPAIAFLAATDSRAALPLAENNSGGAVDCSAGRPLGAGSDADSAGGSGDAARVRLRAAPRHERDRRRALLAFCPARTKISAQRAGLTAATFRERAMKLSAEQLKAFDEQGYVFFPNCFSEEEIALLRTEADNILRLDRQEVWREKTGAPRTAFAAHKFNKVFEVMSRHPRLVEPLMQLFGEPVYVHQFKLNAKAAFEGDVWQWHQDYGTWQRDDGMPDARAMNIAIFLDDVLPINGALMIIPKSHKQGVLAAGHDETTTSYPLWTLDKDTVTRLAAEAAGPDGVGIVAPTGKAGSVLMFHGNLVHASPPNITPYPRKIVYLTLCAVSNHITKFTRPEFIAHRDFTPIVPVDDDALVEYARAHRVAAE